MAFKKTDPAKFVVRDGRFNQTVGYPEFAADMVDFMLEEEIPDAEVLYRVICGAIEEQNKVHRFTNSRDWVYFGKVREDDPREENGFISTTKLYKNRFEDGFKEVLLEREGTVDPNHPFQWEFEHIDPASGVGANLSTVTNQAPAIVKGLNGATGALPLNAPIIIHPMAYGDNWEAIKFLTNAAFQRAVSDELSPEEKKDGALEATSLLAHAMPPYRGGSIVMTAGLEYLAARAGFETDFFKEGCDLYTKAVLRNPEEFRELYKSGKYADPNANSKDIMAWHKQELETGFELGPDYGF